MISPDLYFAALLIVLALAALILARLDVLPKKSFILIMGSLLSFMGITIFKNRQLKKLQQEFRKREARLQEKEKELRMLKEKYKVSEQQFHSAMVELERQKAAYKKSLLQIREKNHKEKERIDQLSGEELHREFLKAFGGVK